MADEKIEEVGPPKKPGITVDALYEMITKVMTPEVALKKLLVSSIINYESLKFSTPDASIHPEIVIIMAMADLGWAVAVENDKDNVEGLTMGNEAYMERALGIKRKMEEEKEKIKA